MKLYFLPLLLTLGTAPLLPVHSYSTTPSSSAMACDEVPDLNQKIIEFVNTKMKKTVGRGECWDLAAEALNKNGAKWDKAFKFGKLVNLKKDCVYPGDIIQFDNVTVEYTNGNRTVREKMAQHTAVIYEIKGPGDYVLADQNTSIHGRKVGLSAMNLKDIKQGKYLVYQPVKE